MVKSLREELASIMAVSYWTSLFIYFGGALLQWESHVQTVLFLYVLGLGIPLMLYHFMSARRLWIDLRIDDK